jgi:hypothetical protein
MMGAIRKKRNAQSEEIHLNEIPVRGRKFSVKDEQKVSDSKYNHAPNGVNNGRENAGKGPNSADSKEMKPSITDDDDNSTTTKDKDVHDSSQNPDHNTKQDHHPSQKIGCLSIKHSLLLRRTIFVVIAFALAASGNTGTLFIYFQDFGLLSHPQLKNSSKISSLVQNDNTPHSNASENQLLSKHSNTLRGFNGSNSVTIRGLEVDNLKYEYLRSKTYNSIIF